MEMSRRTALLALPAAAMAVGAATAGGAADVEDPTITLYRRFIEARAEENRLTRIADGYLTTLGSESDEYRRAQVPANAARDREDAITAELMATLPTTPAGLLLLATVLYDDQALYGDEPEVPGFQNLIKGLRRLMPASDLAVAEQLLALDTVEVAVGWPHALVKGETPRWHAGRI